MDQQQQKYYITILQRAGFILEEYQNIERFIRYFQKEIDSKKSELYFISQRQDTKDF